MVKSKLFKFLQCVYMIILVAALNNAEIRGDTVTVSRVRSNNAPCAADWLRALLGECNDVEGNKYAKDPFHPLSCNKHKRRGGTFRHDGVLQVLINNMRPHSNYVCKEPSNI